MIHRCLVVSLLIAGGTGSAAGQSEPVDIEGPGSIELLRDLADTGLRNWTQRRLARRPSRYRVVQRDGRPVLQADSYGGNSGIFREVHLAADRVNAVEWRWRVASPLDGHTSERQKRGDDFAARVFVIFDAADGPWSGRALCYVWSANQPVETVYLSPYSQDVAMIVVESGKARASTWVEVRRDVLRDFREAFGDTPDSLTALAIMVDTDNTRSRATAWFERLAVEFAGPRPN